MLENFMTGVAKVAAAIVLAVLVLALADYPQYLPEPSMRLKNAERWIKVGFLDHDGFKLFYKTVAIKEFTSTAGPGEKPNGLQYVFTQMVAPDDYKRWTSAQVGWNVDTEVPKAVAWQDTPEGQAFVGPLRARPFEG